MNILIIAALGAIFQELMYWYGKRHEIFENGITTNKRGVYIYLVIVIFVVVGSSAGTYIWFHDRQSPPPLIDVLVFGAAFPALFKVLAKGAVKTGSETKLGKFNESAQFVKKYLE